MSNEFTKSRNRVEDSVVFANRLTARSKAIVKRVLKPMVRRHSRRRVDIPPSHWNLAIGNGGRLSLEGLDLHDLLQKWGSPLHIVHAAKLRENAERFLRPPSGASTGCEIYYSYKTNPVPGVLSALHALGVGAEVISPFELWLAFQLGVPPERIVYNGPGKSDESIQEAVSREIQLLNVNHREEISRVAKLSAGLGKRPRVGIRAVTPEGWGGQFGSRIANGQAFAAFAEAHASPHLNVVALHAHLGGEIRDADQLRRFVARVLDFSDELYRQLDLELEILDFGGSLVTPTVAHLDERQRRLNQTFLADLIPPEPREVLSITDYTSIIVGDVEDHYRKAKRSVPRIFLEPGRAMTGDTQMLLTSVITVKETDEGFTYAILDAGINLAEPARSEFHQIFPVNRTGARDNRTYRLAGPICTPADIICSAWTFPELGPGDSIAIMDAGAYFIPFATSFSFPKPAIVMIDAGRDVLLRRSETFDDLIALDA